MPAFRHLPASHPPFTMISLLTRVAKALGVLLCFLFLTACGDDSNGTRPQDETTLQTEALQSKRQVARLESVIQSLQEGNTVLRQQIDRLNQDARKTEASYEAKLQEAESHIAQLANMPKKDKDTIRSLEQKNKKLALNLQHVPKILILWM